CAGRGIERNANPAVITEVSSLWPPEERWLCQVDALAAPPDGREQAAKAAGAFLATVSFANA
ncbi:MAG: hypothetical protein ACYDB8_13400, partial [Acidiferrobacterales bacterium]